MNLELRLALTAHPDRDYIVAHACNISPSKLSQIVNEIFPATKDQKQKIAKVLNRREAEIFPPRVQA